MRHLFILLCASGLFAPGLRAQGSDACANAQPIAGEGLFTFQLTGATTDGLPNAACGAVGDDQIENDVWFAWTATSAGFATISICALSNVDTRLAAYADVGNCPPTALIACDDDTCDAQSRIAFPILAGASYLLRVGKSPGALFGGGQFRIVESPAGAPANDACIAASWVSGPGPFAFDLAGATTDGSPDLLCIGGGASDQIERDVWFVWTAATTGPVIARTCGLSSIDTAMAAYAGITCPATGILACDDDGCGPQSELHFSVHAGQSYLIRIGVPPGGAPGSGAFEVLPSVGDCATLVTGPDVIVGELNGIFQWGAVGGVSGYSIGTDACNIGDQPLLWVTTTNEHPVIAQNIYRLEDGRFEQLGQSWLKHGFSALNFDLCCTCEHPGSGSLLGVGCSDPYTSFLNGDQGLLGPRWEVDVHAGEFPFPFTTQGVTGDAIYKRIQVRNDELDPALHPGARYFAEGQYVTRDDAQAGNARNNASHRELVVGDFVNGGWRLLMAGPTERGAAAIHAWKAAIPAVELVERDVPGDGSFLVGSLATDNGDGTWRYEYAVFNQTVTRAARAFRVPLPPGVSVGSIGFHDVDAHSGDPYDTTDWTAQQLPGGLEWSTAEHAVNPRANALRWGTLYNFRFVADAPPTDAVATLTLYQPGAPDAVTVSIQAPSDGGLCVATSYCASAPNSQGPGATISASGSTSLFAADFSLHLAGGVPGELGLFFYGPEDVQQPFGDGLRCVGPGALGLFRLNPPHVMDGQGASSRALDFSAPPANAGPGAILPASTWKFQHWYRDPAAAGAGFNLSNGLSVTFCP